MHGYKWPINCTRTRTCPKIPKEVVDEHGANEKVVIDAGVDPKTLRRRRLVRGGGSEILDNRR